MMGSPLQREIAAYAKLASGDHRYCSWEHCYRYFRRPGSGGPAVERDAAAVQLAFYLASWGMYRPSSFLIKYDYTVHLPVIDVIGEPRFRELRRANLGASESDRRLIPQVNELIDGVRKAYQQFARRARHGAPTDTLVTKVILGTVGCLPACDRYVKQGLRRERIPYSGLNEGFFERLFDFCRRHLAELEKEQSRIERKSGVRYPFMKLLDMYFWQRGSRK